MLLAAGARVKFIHLNYKILKDSKDFIFGVRAVIEAINAGKELERVLLGKKVSSENLREAFSLVRQHEIPFQYVPEEKLNRVTRKNHQGIIAFISPVSYYPLEELIRSVYERGEDPLFVYLDKVSDVRNFGAISRSADVLGFNGVIIPEKGSARITADAVKTSAGALLKVPVARVKSPSNTLKHLKDSGIKVVAVSEKAEHEIYNTPMNGPLILLMGNEETGISDNLLFLSDEKVRIPVLGTTESLNVSVAAGVAMYEICRQRSRLSSGEFAG